MKRKSLLMIPIIFLISVGLLLGTAVSAASYDPQVYDAQKALKARGYNPGPADGLWGKATRIALEQFQRDSGLSVTGRLDEKTLAALKIDSKDRSFARAIKRKDTKQKRRLALVIGNGSYKASPLRNPVNDASDIAKALERMGFDVVTKLDAGQRELEDAIYDFSSRLKKGGVGLFYYAGHGVQVNGRNYLIPVDANIRAERDIKYEAVDAGKVLDGMYDAGNGLNIVLLDACRDNPFARSFRTSSQGLARMDAPTGTFIAYATAPGATAADGTGRNGVFTQHLLTNMNTPGLKIEDVLKQVRIGVIQDTGKRQVPWQASSLTGNFYFLPGKEGMAASQPPPATTTVGSSQAERQSENLYWQSIKDSQDPDFYRAYLKQYPKGAFSALARLKLNKLQGTKLASVSPTPSPKPEHFNQGSTRKISLSEARQKGVPSPPIHVKIGKKWVIETDSESSYEGVISKKNSRLLYEIISQTDTTFTVRRKYLYAKENGEDLIAKYPNIYGKPSFWKYPRDGVLREPIYQGVEYTSWQISGYTWPPGRVKIGDRWELITKTYSKGDPDPLKTTTKYRVMDIQNFMGRDCLVIEIKTHSQSRIKDKPWKLKSTNKRYYDYTEGVEVYNVFASENDKSTQKLVRLDIPDR